MPDAARRATLRALGVTDGQLRASAYRSPFRGVHADASIPPSVERRIRDVVPLLPPGAAVGGWAAAWWHGARDLDGVGRDGELPVLVCVPRTRSVRPRPGLRVLRSDLATEEVTVVRGVPVTSAVRTAVDLARLSGEPRRGVIAVDALWAAGATTGPAVLAHLDERRLRGTPVARRAAELAAAGVRSPQETELRMIWTLDAGLPRPLVNERVVDEEGGHLGRVDLLDEEAGLAGEYDGRGHLALEVATVDNVRQEGLERHGLVIARFTAIDTRPAHRRRTVHRLQDAHRRGLATTGPRRWHVARV
ncbi:hypothetical protein AB1207_07205 [Kineococcus endophyticus]|uniref:AbiEi antitoxin C-terminal domain-containing protein n=1 Tax=Kineococcus endophyticus TaxID=1181883 RepID=A0ABV3P4I2_9ACTN